MYTREEFERFRNQWARAMADDVELRRQALDVLTKADHYNWIHQTTWFGEPILQLPQDMFALQEIFFTTRPKYVVELGVAWGGSLLFYSTLMQILGGERAIGVDIYIPDDLRVRLSKFGPVSERICLIQGSSVERASADQVHALLDGSRQVLLILDSDHTFEHVLKELRLYSPLVGKGHYLVCSDTVVEDIPPQTHRPRPWGPGNSPRTALGEFLRENDRFEVDQLLESKLLLTCNPRGYLHCIKD